MPNSTNSVILAHKPVMSQREAASYVSYDIAKPPLSLADRQTPFLLYIPKPRSFDMYLYFFSFLNYFLAFSKYLEKFICAVSSNFTTSMSGQEISKRLDTAL